MAELSCEILVVNASQTSISLAEQETTHGSFRPAPDCPPVIAAGGSARYLARDPGGASGAEGKITFKGDTGGTFGLDYCCSEGLDGNYAWLSIDAPELQITIRFDSAEPPADGDETWGSSLVPANGHPLGILIYVEERPVPDA